MDVHFTYNQLAKNVSPCSEEGGLESVDAVAQGQERCAQELYVASGVYQLPLFKGLPSMALLVEMKHTGDVDGTLFRALKV